MNIDEINIWGQKVRARLFGPFFRLLTALQIKPYHITAFRAVGGPVFLWLFPTRPQLAFILLILASLLDWFDGGLARYQELQSDRGKFWDVLVDHFNYAIAVYAFLAYGPFSEAILGYHLLILPILFLLATIKVSEKRKTDWIIHPYYRIVYFKPIGIIAAFLYIWNIADVVNPALFIVNIAMTLFALYYVIVLHRRWAHE